MPEIISLSFVKFIKGIGIGIVSNCVDSFSVDVIKTKYRGAFNVMIHQAWFVGIGIISAFSLELLKGSNEEAQWRELVAISTGFSIISCALILIIIKESPRF
jgi:hypothetical protein|mmetsp:Transcript_1583/g.168  ORF Transcript_1583/g.168 Transcript_1583/m.168 type:complete len:102 (+) Transcript_1583:326-631(+)